MQNNVVILFRDREKFKPAPENPYLFFTKDATSTSTVHYVLTVIYTCIY